MARLDEERRRLAQATRSGRAADNELTPVQARLFVRSLQLSWQVPPIAWSQNESREQFTDARRLLHAAGIFANVDGPQSSDMLACYRRAGELLEWIARSNDPVTRDIPVALLAAGAYQLAGLPAMATSLLRGAQFGGDAALILAAFLSADFDQLLQGVSRFWLAHADLTGRQGSAALFAGLDPYMDDDAPGDELFHGLDTGRMLEDTNPSQFGQYVVAELVRSLGLFADAIRRGNSRRVAQAQEKIESLTLLGTRIASDELWILLSLIGATARAFSLNSIHLRAELLAERRPEQRPRMWRFAREQFARGRGILWASQTQGIDRLMAQDSFALCTPTGSGKTLVANLALVKELLLGAQEEHAPLALYLVPSRALASEVETKLTAELGEDMIVTGLYGGTDWGITDYWLTADRPVVLIATVEKAEALMRYIGHLLIRRIKLLVIDEAHQVVSDNNTRVMRDLASHNSRSMRLESFVSRLFTLKPALARIALTAVAGGAAGPVAQWIENNPNAIPAGTGYRSSRQLIGALLCQPGHQSQATLEIMNGQTLYVRGRDQPVYLPLRIPPMPNPVAIIRNSLPHYNELNTLWTALHLLEGGRRILISVTQSPELLMKRYAEAFDLPGWETVFAFTPPLDLNDRAIFVEARLACIDYCGVDSYELRLLDHGIATSHGQMPQRIRRLVNRLIERRICPLTIATATLTEGVNLPFDIIFLTSLLRRGFDQQTGEQDIQPMSAAEFRNLAGRAGRPGAAEAMEGMTLVALPVHPSTTADGKLTTQWRQIRRAEAVFEDLLGRLQADETTAADVHSPLVTLLRSIVQKCVEVFGLTTEASVLDWLDATLPEQAGANLASESRAPADQLGDSLDELDGFLLAATEEMSLIGDIPLNGPSTEVFLRSLWQRTFARVVASEENFLERTFIRRGHAFVERLYPNAEQRSRLYQFGFTPYVGRRFELVAPLILAELRNAADYGGLDDEARFRLFFRLGERLRAEPGIAFRVRDTLGDAAILANWSGILGWWTQRPNSVAPDPDSLRAWQRFVADNLEFRLGVAVGAAVAQVWTANSGVLEAPTLETWREATRLPWIGFWFRELLRWGTLDPFVAFIMSQGLAETREQAKELRPSFNAWLGDVSDDGETDALIDPQHFIAWQRSRQTGIPDPATYNRVETASLTGADGRRGNYDVLPIVDGNQIEWIDPAGFSVARSPFTATVLTGNPSRHDFNVNTEYEVRVIRTF